MTGERQEWWSKDTVVVVTGGNKGVGAAIVRLLAEKGVTVVFTSRDLAKGQAGVEELNKSGLNSVFVHTLDSKSSESARNLASWLKKKFGGIDILINNAAVVHFTCSYENAKDTVETNYLGVKNVTEALLPLLRPSSAGARIVNVTSRAGAYDAFRSESLKEQFRDAKSCTQDKILSLANKYLDDVKAERLNEEGWVQFAPLVAPMYTESKVFQNAYSRALAKSLEKSQPDDHKIFVASFCPGVCATEMLDKFMEAGLEAPKSEVIKSAAEGAETGVWLALLPREEWPSKIGKLFGERSEYPFGTIHAQDLGFTPDQNLNGDIKA